MVGLSPIMMICSCCYVGSVGWRSIATEGPTDEATCVSGWRSFHHKMGMGWNPRGSHTRLMKAIRALCGHGQAWLVAWPWHIQDCFVCFCQCRLHGQIRLVFLEIIDPEVVVCCVLGLGIFWMSYYSLLQVTRFVLKSRAVSRCHAESLAVLGMLVFRHVVDFFGIFGTFDDWGIYRACQACTFF